MTLRLLATLLAWAAGVCTTTFAGGPMQDPAKAPKFTHGQHVDDKWFDPNTAEVWRDCRGCHRFDADHRVSAPQAECDKCHIGAGALQRAFAVGWEEDLRGYQTRTRDAFRHHTHHMLECRECHLPPTTNNLVDFDVVTGPGQCERCHEQREPQAGAAMVKRLRWFRAVADPKVAGELGLTPFTPPAEADHAQYADQLVKVFAGPGGGVNTTPLPRGGDFDHDDHAEIGCVDCHAAIPGAAAKDVGTGQIPTATCGTCHVDAAGKPATAAKATEAQVRTLHSLGAFVHADHYRFLQPGAARREGVCTERAYTQLTGSQKNGCDVCHIQDKAAVGLVQPDFPFTAKNSKHTYLDCVACHDVDGWRTGESTSKPFHDSSDDEQDGRNGWGACTSCHVPGKGSMAKERPMVAVERRTASTFRFTTHAHPYITNAASARAELADCAKCHRARVPELPTRLEQRAFRHATHLPPNAQAKDCAGCHPGAENAASSALLAADFRTYSTSGCTTCHIGGAVTEVLAGDAVPASRLVVQFPHGPHSKAGVSCTDCHELDAGGADVATKPAALSCSQCHDHRPDEPGKPAGPKAEGLFGGEATSCVRCHHEPAPPGGKAVEAVPPLRGTPGFDDDPQHRIATAAFAGFEQSQFHPLGGKCTDCHKANLVPDRRYTGIKRTRADHIFAGKNGKVHGGGPQQPENCLACHWTPAARYKQAAAMIGDKELRQLRAEPASKATRERFGNVRKDYPGPKADG